MAPSGIPGSDGLRSPLLPGRLAALPVVVRMLAVKSRAEGRSQFLASEPLPQLETP